LHVHLGVPLTYPRCTKGRVSTVLQPAVVRTFALRWVNEWRVSEAVGFTPALLPLLGSK